MYEKRDIAMHEECEALDPTIPAVQYECTLSSRASYRYGGGRCPADVLLSAAPRH